MRLLLATLLALTAPRLVWAGAQSYEVDPGASQMLIHVGKSGLFKFAGHEHEVLAPVDAGSVTADVEEPGRSTVTLSFKAAALKVTGRGESADDAAQVQQTMQGPKALDVERFPEIHFASKTVAGKPSAPAHYELTVVGDLTLHGTTREVRFPLRAELSGDNLTATGQTTLRQSDFGIEPISVAGVVKVKDELRLEFQITAHRKDSAAP